MSGVIREKIGLMAKNEELRSRSRIDEGIIQIGQWNGRSNQRWPMAAGKNIVENNVKVIL